MRFKLCVMCNKISIISGQAISRILSPYAPRFARSFGRTGPLTNVLIRGLALRSFNIGGIVIYLAPILLSGSCEPLFPLLRSGLLLLQAGFTTTPLSPEGEVCSYLSREQITSNYFSPFAAAEQRHADLTLIITRILR